MGEPKARGIERAAVVGAGLMGSQIAELLARAANCEVTLIDVSDELVARGLASIDARLEKFFVAKGKLTPEQKGELMGRLHGTSDLSRGASAVDFALEAVTENMGVKKEIFRRLDESAPAHAVLASNTSYMSITELGAATRRPDRMVGMHFFTPVAMMKLVEVVRGAVTSDETVALASSLAALLGKEPVVCSDASYGFLANRAYYSLRLEAVQMVWERAAAPEDIDKALKLGYNLPVGPLELGDLGGSWGIYAAAEEDRIRELGSEKGRLHPLVRLMVRAGYTGGPGKKGIYDFYRDVLAKNR